MRLALVGGVLIDGTGSAPRRDVALLVEDGKIAAVTSERPTGPDVRTLDLAHRPDSSRAPSGTSDAAGRMT